MIVGVGFSENPDTVLAGIEATSKALEQAGRDDLCDLILLFSTARHDAEILQDIITTTVGFSVPIIGGGAVGAITNEQYGYAGDQVALTAIWLEGTTCSILVEKGLEEGEGAVGNRLGNTLQKLNVKPSSPVLLFYDAIYRQGKDLRLLMATPLLNGLEQSLGFLPDLIGAGLQGDFACTPTKQWVGSDTAQYSALALTFSDDLQVDSAIMHGCRPATSYYTVTKADQQTILEINGQPALQFMDSLLGPAIPPESYPFFLTLGVNKGDKWGDFDENSYASRLCLAIDQKRQGIVMFEPDMVKGTEFQIMYRSLDLAYMPPAIEGLFKKIEGRKPVFALYIDCAGRAAGYAGLDLEDAVVVQKIVASRVPLLGLYTGVEIASVNGRPQGLDYTGVFCLFSIEK